MRADIIKVLRVRPLMEVYTHSKRSHTGAKKDPVVHARVRLDYGNTKINRHAQTLSKFTVLELDTIWKKKKKMKNKHAEFEETQQHKVAYIAAQTALRLSSETAFHVRKTFHRAIPSEE